MARTANYAWVVGQPAKVADPTPGSRPAPELARAERIERERAGLPEQPRRLTPLEEELARDPKAVLAEVLERDGTEYSATEVRQRNLADADHLARLHVIWQAETREPRNARYERELRDQLPEYLKDAELSGTSTWLYRALRDAEAAGLDSRGVLARAVERGSLADVRDLAAVIDARVRSQTRGLVPAAAQAVGRAGARGRPPGPPRATSARWPGPWTTARAGWVSTRQRPAPGGLSAPWGRCPKTRTGGRRGRTGPPGRELPGDVRVLRSGRADRPGAG